jgi:hypothetical protein
MSNTDIQHGTGRRKPCPHALKRREESNKTLRTKQINERKLNTSIENRKARSVASVATALLVVVVVGSASMTIEVARLAVLIAGTTAT